MTKMRHRGTFLAYVGIMTAFILIIAGCSGLQSKQGSSTDSDSSGKNKGPAPLYYDFGDVLLPPELKLDTKSSFVFQTPGLAAGVLSLKGNVEMDSLIAFFENNMSNDNWRPVSSFKSPRTMLMFQKDNRWCVINITDKGFSTHVEIWVAPTTSETESGLLK